MEGIVGFGQGVRNVFVPREIGGEEKTEVFEMFNERDGNVVDGNRRGQRKRNREF